jgi:hypothetical protein
MKLVHYFEKDTIGSSYGKKPGANLVMLRSKDQGRRVSMEALVRKGHS